MSNFAFQVTGAFQGDGQFAFQGATGGVVVVPPPQIGSNIRFRGGKKKRRKLVEPDVPLETITVELPPQNLPISSLRAVLDEMEQAGFDFIDSEEEDMLVLTFILKKLDG